MKSGAAVTTVEDYIAGFPPTVQKILKQVRATVRKAAPEAVEAIKYGLPTLVQDGNLVHYGAFKAHLGFYALPSGNAAFRRELKSYRQGRGSLQFPFDQPVPYALIARIVAFRVQENASKATARRGGAKRRLSSAQP